MHPILFRIPLPAWELPLFACCLVIAFGGALVALFGWRSRATDLMLVGGAVALGATVAGFSLRGRGYELASVPVNGYGAMLALSLAAGWFLTLHLAERDGLDRPTMATAYLVASLSALAGARLLYIVTNTSDFHNLADLLALRRGGLVAYGGFLGGLAGSWLFLRSRKLPLLPWADVAVPSLALGLFLTRIGCYLFGCDFGRPLSEGAPRWIARLGTFPRWDEALLPDVTGSPAWAQHVATRGLSPDAGASLPVHPTQLYESLAGLALLWFVLEVRRRRSFSGQVFLAFAFAYGLVRFSIEALRDDLERGTWGPALGAHVYLPLMLLVFAAAYNYGPVRSVRNVIVKRASQAASLLPALVAWLVLRPGAAGVEPAQLSTSQWIGLSTAVAAALVWSSLEARGTGQPAVASVPHSSS